MILNPKFYIYIYILNKKKKKPHCMRKALVMRLVSFKLFYKNNDIDIEKCIKINLLYKLNKIKWSHLPTLIINNDNW